jgi:hypothetical protein
MSNAGLYRMLGILKPGGMNWAEATAATERRRPRRRYLTRIIDSYYG